MLLVSFTVTVLRSKSKVLLVLRKQTSDESAFEDEIRVHVENEIKNQLDSMLSLDEKGISGIRVSLKKIFLWELPSLGAEDHS